MKLTKEVLEQRLKELDVQLARAELTKAAVEGAIQECIYHIELLSSQVETKDNLTVVK